MAATPARRETPTQLADRVNGAVGAALFGRRVRASALGLTIAEGLDFEEWRWLLNRALSIADASKWWIGDLLAYGEWRYGTKYRDVLTELDLNYDAARDYAYVAGNVPENVRRSGLSFYHHRAVAKLVPVEQERWLTRATDEAWSVRELREQLAREISPPRRSSPTPGQLRVSVDAARAERWQAAAERAGASIEDWAIAVLDVAAENDS